jgi:hypothetical protein
MCKQNTPAQNLILVLMAIVAAAAWAFLFVQSTS